MEAIAKDSKAALQADPCALAQVMLMREIAKGTFTVEFSAISEPPPRARRTRRERHRRRRHQRQIPAPPLRSEHRVEADARAQE
jgi:hypothetical protein